MFDNEGHWIDDPLEVVNTKPDFSGMGLEPIKTKGIMTNKQAIDRWATYIIPAVFMAEDALKKAKPEWIERLRKLGEPGGEPPGVVAKEYCREVATIIVRSGSDYDTTSYNDHDHEVQQRYTEKIQVGDNVTDIMKLPCVRSAEKRNSKDSEVAYYLLEPSAMADSDRWQFAHPGDWLVKDENGKWHVMQERDELEKRLAQFVKEDRQKGL
jgi:hypothetical protein